MQKQAAEGADEALAGSYLSIKVKLHLSLRKRPLNSLTPMDAHERPLFIELLW